MNLQLLQNKQVKLSKIFKFAQVLFEGILTQFAKLTSKCSFLNSELLIPSTKAMIRVGNCVYLFCYFTHICLNL